jgi:hypothetical protein
MPKVSIEVRQLQKHIIIFPVSTLDFSCVDSFALFEIENEMVQVSDWLLAATCATIGCSWPWAANSFHVYVMRNAS